MQKNGNEKITLASLAKFPDSKFARLLKAIQECPKTVKALAQKSQKEHSEHELKKKTKKKNKPFNLLYM